MLRRLAPALLAALVTVASAAALAVGPAAGAPRDTADYVVVIGVAGLRWEDIDPVNTPTLWRMAEQGSIGSLSVRSARTPTCPSDGWLTLGAGNYAAWQTLGAGDYTAWHVDKTTGDCLPISAQITQPDQEGAHLPDQRSVVGFNAGKMPWGAVPRGAGRVGALHGGRRAGRRPRGRPPVRPGGPVRAHAARRPARTALLLRAEHRRRRHGHR